MHDLEMGPRVAQFVAGDSDTHLRKIREPDAPCDMWIVNWGGRWRL